MNEIDIALLIEYITEDLKNKVAQLKSVGKRTFYIKDNPDAHKKITINQQKDNITFLTNIKNVLHNTVATSSNIKNSAQKSLKMRLKEDLSLSSYLENIKRYISKERFIEICIHEAGHAICRLLLSGEKDSVGSIFQSPKGGGCITRIKKIDIIFNQDNNFIELLAGLYLEQKTNPSSLLQTLEGVGFLPYHSENTDLCKYHMNLKIDSYDHAEKNTILTCLNNIYIKNVATDYIKENIEKLEKVVFNENFIEDFHIKFIEYFFENGEVVDNSFTLKMESIENFCNNFKSKSGKRFRELSYNIQSALNKKIKHDIPQAAIEDLIKPYQSTSFIQDRDSKFKNWSTKFPSRTESPISRFSHVLLPKQSSNESLKSL